MPSEPRPTLDLEQASFLLILAGVTIMLTVIAWPFATPLLWAALAAIMFQPLYRWSLKVTRGRRNMAASLSLLIIFFAVLVPALWIGSMVVEQALGLIARLQEQPIDLAQTFDWVYGMLPETLREAVDERGWTNLAAVQERLQAVLGESAGFIAQQAVSIGGGALSFMLSFALALYVIFFLLRDGTRIGETILHSAPVKRDIADRLADRFLGIVRATIKGSVVVGIVQGTLAGLTFVIAGVPSALLLGVITAIFSLIPVVGTVVVWGPVGVWLLFDGSLWQGLLVLFSGFVIVSSADNVLRPILVGRDTGIPDWIVLITTLGGISLTGFSGIVLGPLVAGLFLATWSILQEQRAQTAEARARYGPRVGPDGRAPRTKRPKKAEAGASEADDSTPIGI
ncbi:putative PurR-regulated permease PerM [Erythrobacter litoralis]|jgi:predicted PurR-regulated permease PerM|uniref:Membrane protein n=1 Tax=Erythrobacter litoralis TaxID=39960 RepID=A0A074MTH7_9SPHN|nr:AI-2E family transporter [Erythrobacter litoralis]AOL24838.1 putative PurR-regulated permease PerM [Erythrobacter litoralis]KEO96814.1 membrane protein [Erythrobacter litoralis]MEE4339177.1 AI-2E family transporter [Erythrobacter sp.]